MTNESDPLVRVAALLGHVARVREARRRTYIVECSCGYTNAGRRRVRASGGPNDVMLAEGQRYVTWHLEKAVRDGRVAGKVRVTAGGNLAVEDAAGEVHLID